MALSLPTQLLPVPLTHSVGVKGKNLKEDVLRVQDALNAIPASEGAPAKLLTPDGIAGPKTCDAIQKFQLKHFGWKLADGRVDPGGATATMLSARLVVHGSLGWNVRRLEAAAPAKSNTAGVRTLNSGDRLFQFAGGFGLRRALYYFRSAAEPVLARESYMPKLDERPEWNVFRTACLCSPYAFVGEGTYSESSPDEDHAVIEMKIQPRLAHVAAGMLNIVVRHQWIHPTTSPGTRVSFAGALVFVRDDSTGERKTPRF